MKLPAIISDLFLWFFLLLLVACGIYFLPDLQGNQHSQTIHLAFQDANEISRGAAVRMMGTEIGYVKDIHLKKDYVDIVIKTNPGSLTIPSGSTFTILFTGLVGSKSIEVVPPPATRPVVRGKPQYIVENPIRLRQALQYQIDIAQALQVGAENFADFFGHHKPVEDLQYNILVSRDATAMAKDYLANLNTLLVQKNKDAGQYMTGIYDTISDFAEASGEAVQVLNPKYLGPALSSSTRYFTLLFSESHAAMRTFEAAHGLRRLNGRISVVTERIERLPPIRDPKAMMRGAVTLEGRMERFHHLMDSAVRFFNGNPMRWLLSADEKVKRWNRDLKNMNRRF